MPLIWYVGLLVVMPPWAKLQLDELLYDFLWSGEHGGLALVAIKKNIYALMVQWVKRFKCSPSGWVSLLTFWCFDQFAVPPHSVFTSPSYFRLEALPLFYQAIFNAWRHSGRLVTLAGLAVGSFLSTEPVPVEAISTKGVYNMCLAASECTPHCTQKYSSSFPDIDWTSTWRSLYLMPLDRQVSDLNWRIAHGVTYTADRLISFGYHFDPMCFCDGTETPGCGPFIILLPSRPLLLIVELCFSGSCATSYFASSGLLRTLSTSSSILYGDNETTFISEGLPPLI